MSFGEAKRHFEKAATAATPEQRMLQEISIGLVELTKALYGMQGMLVRRANATIADPRAGASSEL